MKTDRKKHLPDVNVSFTHFLFSRFRVIATLLSGIPVLIYGCSSKGIDEDMENAREVTAGTEISLHATGMTDKTVTDIFMFNNDRLKRLDSYQRVCGNIVKAASRRGERILVAIVNPHRDMESWRGICSYEGLTAETALLSDDDPSNPLMTGEMTVKAGDYMKYSMNVSRMMSQICINSLRADFLGTEYEGENLTDVRIYLTNVNAECNMLKSSDFSPGLVVNFGEFDVSATAGFTHKEMLVQEIEKVSAKGIPDPIRLFCYPCDHTTETSGSPFTRLVIEGRIRGHLYYYPITINRDVSGSSGIARNRKYVYDITINRSGTSDPDIPIESCQATVIGRIVPWTETGSETVIF